MKKTIEQKLRNLFDYQDFENNPELQKMKKEELRTTLKDNGAIVEI